MFDVEVIIMLLFVKNTALFIDLPPFTKMQNKNCKLQIQHGAQHSIKKTTLNCNNYKTDLRLYTYNVILLQCT